MDEHDIVTGGRLRGNRDDNSQRGNNVV